MNAVVSFDGNENILVKMFVGSMTVVEKAMNDWLKTTRSTTVYSVVYIVRDRGEIMAIAHYEDDDV